MNEKRKSKHQTTRSRYMWIVWTLVGPCSMVQARSCYYSEPLTMKRLPDDSNCPNHQPNKNIIPLETIAATDHCLFHRIGSHTHTHTHLSPQLNIRRNEERKKPKFVSLSVSFDTFGARSLINDHHQPECVATFRFAARTPHTAQ